MGLAQKIILEDKVSLDEATGFLDAMLKECSANKHHGSWLFNSFKGETMSFEIQVIPEGFYTHRLGDYFAFLGYLIERLTAEFGTVCVEDV